MWRKVKKQSKKKKAKVFVQEGKVKKERKKRGCFYKNRGGIIEQKIAWDVCLREKKGGVKSLTRKRTQEPRCEDHEIAEIQGHPMWPGKKKEYRMSTREKSQEHRGVRWNRNSGKGKINEVHDRKKSNRSFFWGTNCTAYGGRERAKVKIRGQNHKV